MVMLSSYTYLYIFFSSRTKHPTDQKIIAETGNFPKQTATLGVEYCAHFPNIIVIEKGT